MSRVLVSLASAGAVAAGLASLFFIDPAHGGFFPPCPVHWAMGLYCPGCGSLRATHELLHGNVLRATEFNPAFFPALAAVAVICISKRIRVSPATPKVLLISMVVFGILRNVPLWPFLLLAPH